MTTQNNFVFSSAMRLCFSHTHKHIRSGRFSRKGVWLWPQRVIVLSPSGVWLSPHNIIVLFKRCASLTTQSHRGFPMRKVSGSRHAESLCFSKGHVALTTRSRCVFPRGRWLSLHRVIVFSKGGEALTVQNHCVFQNGVWPSPPRSITFSGRRCSFYHANSLSSP